MLRAAASGNADSPAFRRSLAAPLLCAVTTGCAAHAGRSLASDRAPGWICQRQPCEYRHLWVSLVLDVIGRPVSRSVGWRFRRSAEEMDFAGTDLFRTIYETGPWHVRVERVDFDLSSSIRQAGAVYAKLELDGAVAVRENILDRQSARRLRNFRAWGARLRLQARDGSAVLVHNGTSARIIVEGENGRRMSIVQVPLPEWPLLDRQVTHARAALDHDALDFSNKCGRETGPEIEPAGSR